MATHCALTMCSAKILCLGGARRQYSKDGNHMCKFAQERSPLPALLRPLPVFPSSPSQEKARVVDTNLQTRAPT